MWRRAYLFLILVRLYFALSPSYVHPDENFQGPEAIAGRVFSYPVHLTWEFTSENPIRSSFPLWLAYGLPMYLLRWIWEGAGLGEVSPSVVYWTLRILMFVLSFVLEDWAIHELVQIPRQRRVAVVLVASSYVTWTLQTHTFSNSIEALAVAWSLVLIGRVVEDKKHSGVSAAAVLGFVVVLGVFNRITFPAFLLVPGLQLLPHFIRKPFSILFFTLFAAFTAFVAISVDTSFYTHEPFTFTGIYRHAVITPLNNFLYNSSSTNLALHGLHPYYQHILANLPQLLGPAFPLLFLNPRWRTVQFLSAISGVLLLSIFPHQEARFLLPAIPLLLSSIRLPARYTRAWIAAWIVFNALLGALMGVYHQGGIVPVQMHIAKSDANVAQAFWWKTYSPPTWLLNGKNERMETVDLMGMAGDEMLASLRNSTECEGASRGRGQEGGLTYLVAPRSAWFLKPYIRPASGDASVVSGQGEGLMLQEVWSYRRHFNLDDLDFGEDGIWQTLKRVVGDRGLVVWNVRRSCEGGK